MESADSPTGMPEASGAVAVKVVRHDRLRSAAVSKLLAAARAAVGVRHPSLAALLDVGADPGLGVAYLVSEFAPGEDLSRRLSGSGPLPPQEAARIGAEVADALGALHAAKALHRDVRPSHVVLGPDGRARLVEAGLPAVTPTASGHGETGGEPIVGSPAYLAPEAAKDPDAALPASDMYSLGATLFHMVAGRAPFVADSPVALIVQHASRAAPPLSSLARGAPLALAKLVDSLLSKDPAARPGAGDVFAALSDLTGAQPAARSFSRGWLWREAALAAELLARGLATAAALEAALRRFPGRTIEESLPASGAAREARPAAISEVARDVETAARRRKDAAFGRFAMETGFARKDDIERILMETGKSWVTLEEAMVRAGVLSAERADVVRSLTAKHLAEADTVSLERALRTAVTGSEALTRARLSLMDLAPGDDRSILDLLVESGAVGRDRAGEIASAFVLAAVSGPGRR